MNEYVTIIGAGLAGAEAAWQAARVGVQVRLIEMRPVRMTPAHRTDRMAELVCSNSLRSNLLNRGPGLLKEEMRILNSLIIRCADATSVPAGSALAVDRQLFAANVTKAIQSHPGIRVEHREVTEIPSEEPCIIASGPLTSEALSKSIAQMFQSRFAFADLLHFYDAVSPIVDAATIDHTKVFPASRYGKGEAAYLNCPFTEEEYNAFRELLLAAEKAPLREFEQGLFFEGCLPIEELAARGRDTMRFGPMKPVGIFDERYDTRDPRRRPFAVVQLRQENNARTLYNIVGFQTRLLPSEQQRVFQTIPGLEQAQFARYGAVHRNTFLNAPRVLLPTLQVRSGTGAVEDSTPLFFAGQITGVEGYIESAACGLVAGINAARIVRGETPVVLPRETALGSLISYITTADPEHFQPMNIHFGLLPPLANAPRSGQRTRQMLAERALQAMREVCEELFPHMRTENANSSTHLLANTSTTREGTHIL